jgi:hypothetical protein
MPSKAHKVYANHKLLPTNLDEIDDTLKKIYYKNSANIYSPCSSYSTLQAIKMQSILEKEIHFTMKENADVVLL